VTVQRLSAASDADGDALLGRLCRRQLSRRDRQSRLGDRVASELRRRFLLPTPESIADAAAALWAAHSGRRASLPAHIWVLSHDQIETIR
jgi:hypothetical protein